MKELFIGLIIVGLLIIIPVCVKTRIEQKTFNKFSKTKATFIEALCTDLRVMPN